MKNSANVFLGFLAGAATGALAGVLLAPENGKKTRQNIASKASQLKDDVTASVSKGVDKIGSFKDSVFSLLNRGESSTSETEKVNNPQNMP